MTKQEKLQGIYTVNDYWICERLRHLIELYSYEEVVYCLHTRKGTSLCMHLDNLELTYGYDSLFFNWDQIFERTA